MTNLLGKNAYGEYATNAGHTAVEGEIVAVFFDGAELYVTIQQDHRIYPCAWHTIVLVE